MVLSGGTGRKRGDHSYPIRHGPECGEKKGVENVNVWTKQHKNVLKTLETQGRYTAKREYIMLDLQEQAPLVLEAYDWLVKHAPGADRKPEDAEYPVWVSYSHQATMMQDPGTVILKLELDPETITPVNIIKWGNILNYSYIPDGAQDARRHEELLAAYGVSDTKAYMSQFYPQIKREIIDSWDRLFDDRILLGNDYKYGIIWELRREWIADVIR